MAGILCYLTTTIVICLYYYNRLYSFVSSLKFAITVLSLKGMNGWEHKLANNLWTSKEGRQLED